MQWDRLWINCRVAAMAGAERGFDIIEDAAVAASGGRIAWVGQRAALPGEATSLGRDCIDLGGAWLSPGLIDAHTHLAFAGERSGEFEQRLEGVSYQEILARGGGILSTVRSVRAASTEALAAETCARADALARMGVTTVEIKSGYGLSLQDERKQLLAARTVEQRLPLRVQKTFLGAHAVAPEFNGDRTAYVEHVVRDILPVLASEGLVDAVDAFCETIAFSDAEVARLFEAAQRLALPVKLHADQLSDCGGAALAARYRALSADHVEYTSEQGVRALAAAGTVAMLLPAAFYFLRETRLPPVASLRRAGVRLALASDCNPGTAPLLNPGTVMNMACTLFRLTPAEAFAGYTREAARALGLLAETGTIEVGKSADFAFWDVSSPAELCYWIDGVQPLGRVFRGEPIASASNGPLACR